MANVAPDLQAVEGQLDELDIVRRNMSSRRGELEDRKRSLQDKRSEAIVRRALGEKSAGLDELEKQIAAVDLEIDRHNDLAESMQSRIDDLTLQKRALLLGIREKRYKDLAPLVTQKADEFLRLRDELEKVVSEYHAIHKEISGLRPAIQADRIYLHAGKADCGDLPAYKRLDFNTNRVHITPEMLKGEKPW